MKKIDQIIPTIPPIDRKATEAALVRQNSLTKPKGSLGRLEELAIQVAGITGQVTPVLNNKVVFVMAGDHGVVEEGVSAYPQEVTAQMVLNFLTGGAAVNVLSRHCDARVVVIDMGVVTDLPPHPDLKERKIARGTANFTRGPAMSQDQALKALLVGVEMVEGEIQRGLDILATGDMGIGNTTPAAAIATVLTKSSPLEMAGRGTGIDNAGLKRKIQAIETALEINQPDPSDGLDVLVKVGGFEIAGLAGAILAAAAHRRPVVIDGFISTAAAMIATSLAPSVKPYLIASHLSQESSHHLMLKWLGLKPLLDLHMRLGEGTGAILAISLIEGSCKILSEMATFDQAGVSQKITV